MPKYYVVSGDLKIVIDRKNHKQAAIDAIKLKIKNLPAKNNLPENLAEIVKVGEQGFDKVQDSDMWFSTKKLLKEAGFKKSRKKKE